MAGELTAEQGQVLARLARQTIAQKLGVDSKTPVTGGTLEGVGLDLKQPTFVTLKIAGRLRGCIGSLQAIESIVDGIRHNAVNAAFHDPRFPRLTRKELDRAEIEVSVLSTPEELKYSDYHDLLSRLRPGIDGIIISYGRYNSATFLPQVWDELPQKEEFLSQLCLKAGLDPYAWKKGDLKVQTYQVQYFDEG